MYDTLYYIHLHVLHLVGRDRVSIIVFTAPYMVMYDTTLGGKG